LYFGEDGDGIIARKPFATLTVDLALTGADFEVI